MPEPSVPAISVRYAVRPASDAWICPEGPVPESTTHDAAVARLNLILGEWARASGRGVRVVRNLAVRWVKERPGIGIDPDVCVLDPPPPEVHLPSLRTWQPGHVAPRLAFEVVSENHPYKDYASIQDRYAALGIRELVVFDPLLSGPVALGGPVALQIWRLREGGVLERIHFGDDPAFSEELQAWLHPRGTLLEIAGDREGTQFWQTGEERERAEKERERAEKERERAEKERERAERVTLERRLAELERKLTGE